MGSSSQTPRFAALDGYRFFAATGVVLFHFDMDFHLGLAKMVPAVAHLSTMVDFFFMLSGFVIAIGYMDKVLCWDDYRRFLRTRLARVYPLHLATLLVSLVFVGIGVALRLRANHPEIIAISGLPANLLLIHAWGVLNHPSFNVPSWSISAEWFVYLAAPLFFALARRAPLLINSLLIALFIYAMIVIRHYAKLGDWLDATFDFGMLRAVPTFFAGVMLAYALKRKVIARILPWWSVHTVFILSILLLGFDFPREFVLVLFAFLIMSAALADQGGAPSIMKGRLLSSLGQSSYGLYMLHVLLSLPVLLMLRRLHLIDTYWSLIAALMVYVAAIMLSLASYRFFEIPIRKWLTGSHASPVRSGAEVVKTGLHSG